MVLPVLQILNNYVQFEVSHGPSDVASVRLSRSRVTDGEWHHLLIELKSAKEGKDIKYLAVMTLDYGMDQVGWCLYPLWNRPLMGSVVEQSGLPCARAHQGPRGRGTLVLGTPPYPPRSGLTSASC